MHIRKIIMAATIATTILSLFTACNKKNSRLVYPEAKKTDVKDTYFGTEVADPYRWLENDTTQEVADWVTAENTVTENYLKTIPFRQQLKERLTKIVDYEKFGAPFMKKGKYYFFKNDGLQNQSVLYVKESLNGEASVLLDPNTLSDDGTVALAGIFFSNDARYLAYSISRSGSDWQEFFVMDLTTKQLIKDHLLWAKFSGASWCGNGFYYSAYDAPEAGKEYSNMNKNHKIYYHKIGDDQRNDQLFYSNPQFPQRFYSADVNEDETVLFLSESGANTGNRLFMKDLTKSDSPLIEIAHDDQYDYSPVEVIGNTIYFFTNQNAPKYRLAKADIASPKIENWKDVLPEADNVLSGVDFTNGQMIVQYDKDASNHAYIYSLDGVLKQEIKLPTLGSVGFSCDKNEKDIFYSFTSFAFPTTIYKYDITTNKSEVYIAPKVDFNPNDFVTEQRFFASKDGTKVPMFITYKKGMKIDGENPVFLYGYGGFNYSLTPGFFTFRLPFLENGGIYAQVNLRGGGEYGEAWHLAGTKMQKQNVFDDFIAAAEYLIAEKFTNKEKIAIVGGSNGGLLVGACVNQRPDLFKVAIPEVGVMDMLRYHKFTIGWNWASDYGTSEDSKEMFEYLHRYSPLHNIKNDGTPYPAILITTADHDDRVVPAHSFKYAATLQASNTGNAPKLIRIDTKAGHGGGKPIAKTIDEQTDIYAFIMYHLGMKPKL
ncbi:MAG: prolyl oligopeptidase family serine peptidase [Bacteroidales bacterium]|jgi:prolyl oligopeptidase|nr:prolyl oligopeptidase family serine peptidase [Bacteroidales bacterium]